MTLTQQIENYVRSLFEVFGITQLSDTDNLIILGLESRADRNLDEFGYVSGHFRMHGYEKHVGPRLNEILDFIQKKGYHARPLGKLGYPLNGQIYLKGEVLRSGLGKRGKNTVILHPKYGPRLRFSIIVTDAPLIPLVEPVLVEEENPVCDGCSTCLDVCPQKILEPYRMTDPSRCLSDSANMVAKGDRLIPCDLCLKLCPAGKVN